MHQNLEARNFIFFLLYMHFGRQHAVFSIRPSKGIDLLVGSYKLVHTDLATRL